MTVGKNISDIIKGYLLELCQKENYILDECNLKDGKVCFKIRQKCNMPDKIGDDKTVEHEFFVTDINISRIRKRIRQLFKDPFDEKECVPNKCKFISSNYCTINGKEKELCTQIKYQNKP